MTMMFERTETCAVCGSDVLCQTIGSTSTFGPPDLDTRPSAMARSTLPFQIHSCPMCGYCAPDLADSPLHAGQIVRSEAYQNQLKESEYPELASRYLCWSMIQEGAGDYPAAGWAAVRAAWACDDEEATHLAGQCRSNAVRLFRQASARGLRFAQGPGAEQAVLADLLRRSGHFTDVEIACRQGLEQGAEGLVRKVLTLQMELAKHYDIDRHTLDEAE